MSLCVPYIFAFVFFVQLSQENGAPSPGPHVSVDSPILLETLIIWFQLISGLFTSRFNIRQLVSYLFIYQFRVSLISFLLP